MEGVCKSLNTVSGALRGHCEVPSRPGSQPVAGRQGRGMFMRGRLLLRAFKSFLGGSCLCIRLRLTWSQEWEGATGCGGGRGSKRVPETQAPTHSLAHSHALGTWGVLVEGGAV